MSRGRWTPWQAPGWLVIDGAKITALAGDRQPPSKLPLHPLGGRGPGEVGFVDIRAFPTSPCLSAPMGQRGIGWKLGGRKGSFDRQSRSGWAVLSRLRFPGAVFLSALLALAVALGALRQLHRKDGAFSGGAQQ